MNLLDHSVFTQSAGEGTRFAVHGLKPGVSVFRVTDTIGNDIEIPVIVNEKIYRVPINTRITVPKNINGYELDGIVKPDSDYFRISAPNGYSYYIEPLEDGVYPFALKLYNEQQGKFFYWYMTIIAGSADYGDLATPPSPPADHDGSLWVSNGDVTIDAGAYVDVRIS